MKTAKKAPTTIDEYIAGVPKAVQPKLRQIRAAIKKAVPGAEETIKYQMPTFVRGGNLVHFGVYKSHIGLYPAPTDHPDFKAALAPYRGTKSTARFPLDQPMPLGLVGRIAKFRARQVTAKKAGRAG